MTDRALRYFLAVARAGSIRGAAEALHVAASAISRQVAELEAALGEPLLERQPRGVVPTEAGRIVAEHAQRLADEAALLEDRLRRLRGGEQGLVRIRCGDGFLTDLMERGLIGFAAEHPGLSFRVSLDVTDGILQAVAEGEADLGLAYDPPAHALLRSVVVAPQPVVAVLPPGHALAGDAPLPLRDFAAEPATLLPADHGLRRMLSRVEADGGFLLRARLETESFDLQRRFVLAGMGVAFLPRFAVAAELAAGRLLARPLSDVLLAQARAHLLVRADRRLPEAVERMLAWLSSRLSAFGAGDPSGL